MSDIRSPPRRSKGRCQNGKGAKAVPRPTSLRSSSRPPAPRDLPKAVGCTHGNLIGDLEPIAAHVPGLESETGVNLNVLPNFHAFGYTVAGLLALTYGMAQTVVPSFVPVENTIKAIKESGVNRVIAVPTVMAFLLGALEKRGERIEGVRLRHHGRRPASTVQMEGRCASISASEYSRVTASQSAAPSSQSTAPRQRKTRHGRPRLL